MPLSTETFPRREEDEECSVSLCILLLRLCGDLFTLCSCSVSLLWWFMSNFAEARCQRWGGGVV